MKESVCLPKRAWRTSGLDLSKFDAVGGGGSTSHHCPLARPSSQLASSILIRPRTVDTNGHLGTVHSSKPVSLARKNWTYAGERESNGL